MTDRTGGDVARSVTAQRRPLTAFAQQAGPRGIFYTTEGGHRERLEYGRWLVEFTDAQGDRRRRAMDDHEFRRDWEIVP